MGSELTLGFTKHGGGIEDVDHDALVQILGRCVPNNGGQLELVFLNGSHSYGLGERISNAGVPHVVCWESTVPSFAAAIFSQNFYQTLDTASDPSYKDAFQAAVAAVQKSFLRTPYGVPHYLHAKNAASGGSSASVADDSGVAGAMAVAVVGRSIEDAETESSGTSTADAEIAKTDHTSCVRLAQVHNLIELNINSFVDRYYTIDLLDWEWPTLKLYEWSLTKSMAEVEALAKRVLGQGGVVSAFELPLELHEDARHLARSGSSEEDTQETLLKVCKDVERLLREVLEHATATYAKMVSANGMGGVGSGVDGE
jgi:hypothetical protein